MGLVTILCAAAWLLSAVDAAVLRLPLQESHSLKHLNRYASHISGRYQVPLKSPFGAKTGSPLTSVYDFFYTTNITVGTPPQPFTVAIDISRVSTLFVPSIKCKDHYCDPDYPGPPRFTHRYNSSLSTTYVEDGRLSRADWTDLRFYTVLSQDVIRVAGIEIPDQLFEEFESVTTIGFAFVPEFGYDGVLGLAPPWSPDDPMTSNLMKTFISKELLESPLFSLKLPRAGDAVGELLLGEINADLYTGDIFYFPAIKTDEPPGDDMWSIRADSITFHTSEPIHVGLETDSVALLDISLPMIAVPSDLYSMITKAVNASALAHFMQVPCETIPKLPKLSFQLGEHNFTITSSDYTMAMDIGEEEIPCILTIEDIQEYGIPPNNIVLGSPFLKEFYSVFDAGNESIGLAKLK